MLERVRHDGEAAGLLEEALGASPFHRRGEGGGVERSVAFVGRGGTATAGVEEFSMPDGVMYGSMFVVAVENAKHGADGIVHLHMWGASGSDTAAPDRAVEHHLAPAGFIPRVCFVATGVMACPRGVLPGIYHDALRADGALLSADDTMMTLSEASDPRRLF